MSYEKLDSGRLSGNPKETAGFFSLLTFSWLNDLLRKGNQRPLENDDLPPLLEEDQCRRLTENLEKEWSQNCKETANATPWIKTARLWCALLRLIPTSEKVLVMAFAFTHIVLRLIQPLFLIGLLAELSKQYLIDRTWIYLYTTGICLSTWLIAISKCHCDYRSSMLGMRMRSALLGIIYKKVSGAERFLGERDR